MTTTFNIKHFSDYREFLETHFELKASQNKSWSYGVWSKRLGLQATSSLTKIIKGERDPGPSITAKLIQYFDFNSLEANYFKDLVRLSKAGDDVKIKILLMEKMGREYPDAQLKVLDDKSFAIISNWFSLAIRELVRLSDFQEDPEWIQSRLKFGVEREDITKTIIDLLHQGLLKRDASGKLRPSSGLLQTTNDVSSEAIKRYHEQMLDNAKRSLRDTDVILREMTAETLTINTKNLSVAKEMIREFKAKFSRLLEEQQGDETYQLQIQFFPLTKELTNEH